MVENMIVDKYVVAVRGGGAVALGGGKWRMEHASKLNGAGTNSGEEHGSGTNIVCGYGRNVRMKFVGMNHEE
jgi:hypothetical protein